MIVRIRGCQNVPEVNGSGGGVQAKIDAGINQVLRHTRERGLGFVEEPLTAKKVQPCILIARLGSVSEQGGIIVASQKAERLRTVKR